MISFRGKDIEAQRSHITHPRSHSQLCELGFHPWSLLQNKALSTIPGTWLRLRNVTILPTPPWNDPCLYLGKAVPRWDLTTCHADLHGKSHSPMGYKPPTNLPKTRGFVLCCWFLRMLHFTFQGFITTILRNQLFHIPRELLNHLGNQLSKGLSERVKWRMIMKRVEPLVVSNLPSQEQLLTYPLRELRKHIQVVRCRKWKGGCMLHAKYWTEKILEERKWKHQ